MRRSLVFIVIATLFLTSCEDKRFQTYLANVPTYMSFEDLRSSFAILPDQVLEKPGKIYFKDAYIFINEYQKGIHVIDVSDLSSPVSIGFMNIPGNVDMAVKDNILYADSYTDLLLIDISDPAAPVETKRVEDIFQYVIPPYDYDYPLDEIHEEKGVILGYEIKEVTKEISTPTYPWPIYWDYVAMESSSVRFNSGKGGGGSSTYGVAGSMARFLTHDNYLYALESTYILKAINIEDIDNPVIDSEKNLWGGIETIFISGTHMYVGSMNGMHILSLENPGEPALLSTYQHITSCDPVVVSGNRAFVTLRSGNFCGGDQNLLEVIDVSDKYDPELTASYAMTEPYGLGIDGNTLFVCEGEYGLKIYDASNSHAIADNMIAEFEDINATDVIPLSSYLFMIGDDGFYIYDYSDLNDITLMGTLPVINEE